MSTLPQYLREKMRRKPDKKSFRIARHKLLEITIMLEVQAKVIRDFELTTDKEDS